jgi:hypothetical protein
MTSRDTPAIYEDPSRLSRMVVISCAVVAALLTFLMILPPLLSLFGHRSVTTPHNDNAASTARTAAAASLDQLSQTAKPIPPQTAKPVPPAGAPAAKDSSTAAIAETSRTVVSSGVEAPQSVPPEPPAPPTNGRSPENPSAWVAAIQSKPDPGPTAEVDAEPVAPPPLPRIRPHHVTVAGVAAIPLPPPRPAAPTESASTDRESTHERLDPF